MGNIFQAFNMENTVSSHKIHSDHSFSHFNSSQLSLPPPINAPMLPLRKKQASRDNNHTAKQDTIRQGKSSLNKPSKAHMFSQKLKQQAQGLHGSWPLPCIYSMSISLMFLWNSKSGSGCVSVTFACSWDVFLLFSCLVHLCVGVLHALWLLQSFPLLFHSIHQASRWGTQWRPQT